MKTKLVTEFHYTDGDVGAHEECPPSYAVDQWSYFGDAAAEDTRSHVVIRPDTEEGQALSNRLHLAANPFVVQIKVTPQQIADLMVTCVEGGSNYWCRSIKPATPEMLAFASRGPWYADPKVYAQDGLVLVVEEIVSEVEGLTEDHQVTVAQLVEGFAKRLSVLADILIEDYPDAAEADAWLQLAVLGEVRYG